MGWAREGSKGQGTGERVQTAQRVAGCKGGWHGQARWGRSCNASPDDWLARTRRATR